MSICVYIPTRNRVALLERAVRSVLAQTYQDWELVIVDDASTDQTPDFLRELASTDARVKVFTQTSPQGAPRARNLAISSASSEFVTGLDDDDEFHPTRLAAFVSAWASYQTGGQTLSCLYAQDLWMDGGQVIATTTRRGSIEAHDLCRSNDIGNQVFAPKSLLLGAGLFDPEFPAWQDLEFFYRLLSAYGTARLVDVPTYSFDVSPRVDRISLQHRRLRVAYKRFCEKHMLSGRQKQLLALQLFSDYYKVRPTLIDLLDFLRGGWWPRGLVLAMRRGVNWRASVGKAP